MTFDGLGRTDGDRPIKVCVGYVVAQLVRAGSSKGSGRWFESSQHSGFHIVATEV